LKRSIGIISILLIIIINRTQAQDYLSDPGKGFNSAMRDYNNERYSEAFQKFAALSDKYQDDSHNSVFRFMAAKSLFESGDYAESDSLWTNYLSTFPGSTLIPEVHLFKGHSLYKLGKLAPAADQYLLAIEPDPKSTAAVIAYDNLMPLVRAGLNTNELMNLQSAHPTIQVSEQLDFAIAKKELDARHYRKGVTALETFIQRYPGSHDYKQVRLLLEESREKAENQLSIGLLAPVSGSFQEYGQSMIEGARLALKDFKDQSLDIELDIKDTGSDAITAAKITRELADNEPIAAVGPLSSEAAISAAIILNERKIPMITPTASESGLTSIGPYIFQISPAIEKIGDALGSYAVRNLNLNEQAIIAPDDPDGIKISNAFAEAVYKLGGEVISTTYYPAGATDFKAQIMPLHDILVAKAEAQLEAGKLDSEAFLDPKTHEMLNKDQWPVSLDGLFLPGYADDLKMLIPQIRYHVIHTRFLGGDSWDSPDLMREVKPYVENAIYATDFHTELKNPKWANFSSAYKSAYGHGPDKAAATTYDAISMILSGILAQNKDPEKLRDYLSQIEDYKGVSTNISFKETNRANDEVGIYSIDGKRLSK
jgi:ABC-type branched-subunit amino acid transport system substrate-binding protein